MPQVSVVWGLSEGADTIGILFQFLFDRRSAVATKLHAVLLRRAFEDSELIAA